MAENRAVVALESTILAHGLPPGRNREVAGRLEAVVRAMRSEEFVKQLRASKTQDEIWKLLDDAASGGH